MLKYVKIEARRAKAQEIVRVVLCALSEFLVIHTQKTELFY